LYENDDCKKSISESVDGAASPQPLPRAAQAARASSKVFSAAPWK
jgi:hypothetical protein